MITWLYIIAFQSLCRTVSCLEGLFGEHYLHIFGITLHEDILYDISKHLYMTSQNINMVKHSGDAWVDHSIWPRACASMGSYRTTNHSGSYARYSHMA